MLATITLRVWFLFLRTPIIRRFAVTVSALCISGTYISAGVLWHKIKGQVLALESIKNTNDHSSVFVWLFVPSLVLHSVLFALKVCRFITSPTYLQTDTLLWRFMKECVSLRSSAVRLQF
ncbi:hypothetical protein F5I97DRAFT_1442325 [Phlebopus sp. FC_14]|nr:hypothetical protein F5I97DRAFT_1442325 [Phlebopus sp. FC_14]